MRDGRFSGVGIQNLSEIRAPNAEKAGYYLDYALSSRSVDSQVSVQHFEYSHYLYWTFFANRVEIPTSSTLSMCTNTQLLHKMLASLMQTFCLAEDPDFI
jgi:hypothetical protein